MAKRGWDTGWPAYPWAPAIKRVIDQERKEALRVAATEQKQEREHNDKQRAEARDVSVKAWSEVGKMLAYQRAAVVRQAAAAAHLTDATVKLAPKVAEEIKKLALQPTVDIPSTMAILRGATSVIERLTRAVTLHIESEKLFFNDPLIPHDADTGLDTVSAEEGLLRVKAAYQGLKSFQEGHLFVIEGGKSNGVPEPDAPPAQPLDAAVGNGSGKSDSNGHGWDGK